MNQYAALDVSTEWTAIYVTEETGRKMCKGKVTNGRVPKRGNRMTRTHLYEAANALLTRGDRFSTLGARGLRLAKASGFKRAKVAVARKLAVILHAMWKADAPFR